MITNCPDCNSVLVKKESDADHFCINPIAHQEILIRLFILHQEMR